MGGTARGRREGVIRRGGSGRAGSGCPARARARAAGPSLSPRVLGVIPVFYLYRAHPGCPAAAAPGAVGLRLQNGCTGTTPHPCAHTHASLPGKVYFLLREGPM